MSGKAELIRIAAELKQTADRLLECAKEDDAEESEEEHRPKLAADEKHLKAAMLAVKLKNKDY